MGYGQRIFIVKDDDSIHRLPVKTFNRLYSQDPGEKLPHYAGSRVRCVMVALETENRKPKSVLQMDFIYLAFNSDGMLNIEKDKKQKRLAIESVQPFSIEQAQPEVIDAGHRFAGMRYKREFNWEPSQEVVSAIMEAIFRIGKPSR